MQFLDINRIVFPVNDYMDVGVRVTHGAVTEAGVQ